MKDFLKHHGLWVLFAAAVIAVALAVMSLLSNTSSPLVNAANVLASPFRSAYTAVATWFNDKQNYYKDTTALEEENAALRRRIAEMEEEVRQAESDRAENARLRELLNLTEQRREFTYEAAYITEHAVTNWTSSLTLNKGTAHGIAVGDCVVDETHALVGVVSVAGTNWCTVLTIVDTDTSLGAQVFRTKDLGLAQGDFSLMSQGLVKLNYLPEEAQLVAGDEVVTSGRGDVYPSGLVVGQVEGVFTDPSGQTRYATVRPAADLDSFVEVFVIKDFTIQE